ncbi:uncharacterized protein [Nicotiana tomentosiformis]|uniref:uncharacterized protein n=1 Tax=Nicotiana tomentosiformis TaxID=4098 RepID=UPI00388CE204
MPEDEQRRLERFGRLHPPSFCGTDGEDAQGFLDRYQRILHTVGILEANRVSFTTFQFSGATFSWWEAYERRRPVSAAPLTWQQFSGLFLEKQGEDQEVYRWPHFPAVIVYDQRVSGATFDEVVDITRQIKMVRSQERVEREAKRPHRQGGFSGAPSGAQRMVEKVCLSYLAFVRDISARTPAIDSLSVVHDILDVFPVDLPGMPPDRDINFGGDGVLQD